MHINYLLIVSLRNILMDILFFVGIGNEVKTEEILADIMNRWIFGLYYVSQVLLVIGFGDMM